MKYERILMAVTDTRWAIEETKLAAILDFLDAQNAGVKFDAAEIEARIAPATAASVARKEGQVAVLPLRGVIANRMNMMSAISGGTSSEGFAQMFQAALRDDGVKAIVIDVDSPGGAVSGTPELSSMIFNARGTKPIVSHVNATAASAAYWIASAADEVVVTPSGMVGSIGAYGVHTDNSKALEAVGVKKTLISAGKYKTAGNSYEPLGDEARSRIQKLVDTAYGDFVASVARNRDVGVATVRGGFGEGDMVDATSAKAEGMIDRIATLEETLQRFGASSYAPAEKRRSFASAREKRALDL